MRAAQGVDVAGYVIDLVRLERVLPGDHALGGHAVPDRRHIVRKVAAVNPVIIGEVGPHQPATVRAVARRAQRKKGFMATREEVRVFRRLQGGNVRFKLRHGGPFERVAGLHFLLVLSRHEIAGAQHVVIRHIDYGEGDGEVEQPHPPAGQLIIQFTDAVHLVIHQQRVVILTHGVPPG